MLERIQHIIAESMDLQTRIATELAPLIEHAGHKLVACLLEEGRIMTCGNGQGGATAQAMSAMLVNRFERERPPLPAFSLAGDPALLTAIADDYGFNETFSKQIMALGFRGDSLVIMSPLGYSANILQAIQAAHDREMLVVALTGMQGGEASNLLLDSDIEIRVPSERAARIHEMHLMIVHILCDYIDQQLFGAID